MGSHIVRIDKPKYDPARGTHGWQVRVGKKRGYHSKLFSDNVYGSKGKALVAAEEYLEKYLEEHPEEKNSQKQYPHGFNEGDLRSNNKSGVNGVYRTHHYFSWDKNKTPRYYWAAFCPIGPEGQRNRWTKRFYVDTHGEHEAKRRAVEFRKMWEEAALQGEKAIKEFFEREHYDQMEDYVGDDY